MNEINIILKSVRFERLVPRKNSVHGEDVSEQIFQGNIEEPIFKNNEVDEKIKDLTDLKMARVAGIYIFE